MGKWAEAQYQAEANAFAMELLMPRAAFLKAADHVRDLNDDDSLRQLAAKFKVPIGVATARLIDLRARSQNTPDSQRGDG